MTQVLWITFAPITGEAARFYDTSDLMIGLLSMSFMIVYILVVLPAAWASTPGASRRRSESAPCLTARLRPDPGPLRLELHRRLHLPGRDRRRPAVRHRRDHQARRPLVPGRGAGDGLGPGHAGPLPRAPGGHVSHAIARPAPRHGPHAPDLRRRRGGRGPLVLLLAREHPPTPAGRKKRVLMFDGLKSMLRRRDFLFLLVIFFVGLGLFNSVSTWIEDIVRPRGFTIAQAGPLGGLMLVGGIVGASSSPLLSDKIRRRKPFIVLAIVGLLPGLLGMTFATERLGCFSSRASVFGFFLLSAGPHRLPVRRRDHPSGPRGHVEQAAPGDGPSLGHHLHPGHGRPQGAGVGGDDGLAPGAGGPDRSQRGSRFNGPRIAGLRRRLGALPLARGRFPWRLSKAGCLFCSGKIQASMSLKGATVHNRGQPAALAILILPVMQMA